MLRKSKTENTTAGSFTFERKNYFSLVSCVDILHRTSNIEIDRSENKINVEEKAIAIRLSLGAEHKLKKQPVPGWKKFVLRSL